MNETVGDILDEFYQSIAGLPEGAEKEKYLGLAEKQIKDVIKFHIEVLKGPNG